ncbi:AIPR family protein [Dokdonella sp.]|uniref:AIPR family protein n=1 Tax=Dokdonella sp. TaxID=2291710 RepID=UPI003528C3FE
MLCPPASADLYEKFGARLLETNVRGFLSERGKVNRGIRSTIQNSPQMFFAYNNGLTATASSVELDEDNSRILDIKDLQIVNGGQTTASLFWARKKHKADLGSVSVQMKLSVIPDSLGDSFDEIVGKISEYANSQNKVSEADLSANRGFHREMEKISRRAGRFTGWWRKVSDLLVL